MIFNLRPFQLLVLLALALGACTSPAGAGCNCDAHTSSPLNVVK